MTGGSSYLLVLLKQKHSVIGVVELCYFLYNVCFGTINGKEWNIIFFFSFLSKTKLHTSEVNLFDKFRYRKLLTYFSEVLLGRLDLDPTLNWEISIEPCILSYPEGYEYFWSKSWKLIEVKINCSLHILFGKDSHNWRYWIKLHIVDQFMLQNVTQPMSVIS